MDKIVEWISNKFQHPLSLLFFLLGVLLILLGVSENLEIPVLNQVIIQDKFRWFSIIIGSVFCLLSIALYYFPPKSKKAETSTDDEHPSMPNEFSLNFLGRREILSNQQDEILRYFSAEAPNGEYISQDSIEQAFKKYGRSELFYRLEHLRLLGFLENQKFGKDKNRADQFSYKVSDKYRSSIGSSQLMRELKTNGKHIPLATSIGSSPTVPITQSIDINNESISNVKILKHITEDKWISSNRKNRQSIDSSFLTWNECTLLLWVLVPRKGEGLRNAPHNKYIFAHQTGDGANSRHFNAFFLRYSSNNTWDFVFSNPKGEILPDNNRYRFEDGLEAGWHHIQITWNHSKPLLTFFVDGGDRISIQYQSYLNYWPREYDDSVFIGTIPSPHI